MLTSRGNSRLIRGGRMERIDWHGCRTRDVRPEEEDDQRSVGLAVGLRPSGWSGWLDWAGPVWVGHLFFVYFFLFSLVTFDLGLQIKSNKFENF